MGMNGGKSGNQDIEERGEAMNFDPGLLNQLLGHIPFPTRKAELHGSQLLAPLRP